MQINNGFNMGKCIAMVKLWFTKWDNCKFEGYLQMQYFNYC